MPEKLEWKGEKLRGRPIINAHAYSFRNLGLKHLDDFYFTISGVGQHYIFTPHHRNSMSNDHFTVEYLEKKLCVRLKDLPAFERFAFSILEFNHYDLQSVKGASKHYVIRAWQTAILRLAFVALVLWAIYLIFGPLLVATAHSLK